MGARSQDSMTRAKLEALYRRYNRREYICPDPLEVLYRYRDTEDRVIAGLVAALLAYGGVKQIVASAGDAVDRMEPSPHRFLSGSSSVDLRAAFRNFKHRWTRGDDVAALLAGVKGAIAEYGSLERSFLRGLRPEHETVLPALAAWVELLRRAGGSARRDLLSCPRAGSACKRLNLFLRWMARCDDVDPGLWKSVPASKLIVPMDLHMHRIALGWGLTRRKQADLKTALEVTAAFRAIAPDDPVKYDFALTRASMRGVRFQVSGVRKGRENAAGLFPET
jgi:uncharacterized protein (TIGR02757 family)